jgi:methionyl-tRNA formyltransferase
VEEVIASLASGAAVARAQTTQGVTYARKIEKAEAEINWSRTAEEIERQVRAFIPWPVAQTRHGQQVLRIWQAIALTGEGPPAQVLAEASIGIDVACGHGILRLTQLQLPGGRPMPVEYFLNAHSLATARLG